MPVATMIAGPNGSGKSTLTEKLKILGFEFGEYFNADDIARGRLGNRVETAAAAQQVVRAGREAALAAGRDYTFETVMSHPSHIEHLRDAAAAGFVTRLFFVATNDPRINEDRVANRVVHGGHDVPSDRIRKRYDRCLANLPEAINTASYSLIFDNSEILRPFRALAEVVDRQVRHLNVRRLKLEGIVHLPDTPAWWLAALRQLMAEPLGRDGPLR